MRCQTYINKTDALGSFPDDNDKAIIIKADNTVFVMTVGQIKSCLFPPDLNIIVGQSQEGPNIGDSVWVNQRFKGWQLRITLNKEPQTDLNWDGIYFEHDIDSDQVLFHGLKYKADDLIQIQFCLGSQEAQPQYIVEEDSTTQITDDSDTPMKKE